MQKSDDASSTETWNDPCMLMFSDILITDKLPDVVYNPQSTMYTLQGYILRTSGHIKGNREAGKKRKKERYGIVREDEQKEIL